jgi:Family of unknown function (DUF6084)
MSIDLGTLPELGFAVRDAARVEYTAIPTLRFKLEVQSLAGHDIRSVMLDAQVQIAARRRGYDTAARDRLFELFGHERDWGSTLRTLMWTRTTLVVPPFTGRTVVDLDVACTYDLEVAATAYFDALDDGEVPLEFLFSGSVFYTAPSGHLQTTRISWEQDAEYRLPVRVWRETMEHHFPGTAWLRLPKGAFDRLVAYKARNAFATWEDAIDALLPEEGQG